MCLQRMVMKEKYGKDNKKLFKRTAKQDSFKGKWDNSGATEHTLTGHEQFN